MIPLPEINSTNAIIITQIEKLVDKLLQLNKDIKRIGIPLRREQIQSRISYSENRIDELVFELFGLSKKDIEIMNNNL